VLALAGGVIAVPALRLEGLTGENWNPALIRPPGSLREPEFLQRCIKCGQCMRVCPTNIIHPGALGLGFESIWTPTLNFRVGTSGCQLNCVACGHVCPTSAIRPISLQEKHGKGEFAEDGPIRLGTAFVDHGRCLPWAMDRPCIVCQENCPVSPKAIIVQEHFSTVRGGIRKVRMADSFTLDVAGDPIRPGQYSTGDYFVVMPGETGSIPRLIVENSDHILRIGPEPFTRVPVPGAAALIQVRLQRPQVDPERCIGCGVCEHECPVSGLRAIRVTAENETRSRKHSLLL
jgi:ferredoxin